jgi:hypothetical protein
MIAQTFEAWKHCIEKDCKIVLSKEFAQKRLLVYEQKDHQETQTFIRLYGQQHLNNIIKWLKQV